MSKWEFQELREDNLLLRAATERSARKVATASELIVKDEQKPAVPHASLKSPACEEAGKSWGRHGMA